MMYQNVEWCVGIVCMCFYNPIELTLYMCTKIVCLYILHMPSLVFRILYGNTLLEYSIETVNMQMLIHCKHEEVSMGFMCIVV